MPKQLPKIALAAIVTILTLTALAIEIGYYYISYKLDLNIDLSQPTVSDSVRKLTWASIEGTSQLYIEPIGPLESVMLVAKLLTSDIPATRDSNIAPGLKISSFVARSILFSRQNEHYGHLQRWVATIWVTNHLSADDALNYLLQKMYFGNGISGIEDASKIYFNKSTDELDINEELSLVAISISPSAYNPCRYLQQLTQAAERLGANFNKNWPQYSMNTYEVPEISSTACTK